MAEPVRFVFDTATDAWLVVSADGARLGYIARQRPSGEVIYVASALTDQQHRGAWYAPELRAIAAELERLEGKDA